MARKPDQAHLATDKEIEKIEKEISKEYRKAHKEMKQKLDDYFSQFARKDKQWQEWVKDGKVTQNDYIDWRKGQILIGKRWEDMVDVLATDLSNTAQIAQSIAKGHAPEVYAINHNYATFDVEKGSGLDTSYTLYSRETVERMYRENPKLYHRYGKAVEKEIKEGKQKAWDKKRIRSVLTQAVLQGESIPKITKRLELVTGGDHNAAIRNARTMMTGVQNAGRIDAMDRAKNKGIPVRKQWLATVDGRTRHWHRELDGATAELDEPFENSVGKIMFPADPDADGANVYNCRCTLLSAIKGFELDVTDPSIRPMPKLKGMTYEEWKNVKTRADVPPAETKKAFVIAKSKDEAEAFANKYGITADYSKYNLDVANVVNKTIKTIIDEFGEDALNSLNTIGTFPKGYSTRWKGVYSPTFKSLWLRNVASKDAFEKMGEIAKGQHEVGYWSTPSSAHTIRHELGHAIEDSLKDKYDISAINAYRQEIRTEIMRSRGKKHPEDYLSEYGLSKTSEFIAESVAEYLDGNPRETAREVVRLLKGGTR